VKITKEVYEYALKNGKLLYPDLGVVRDIKLNTQNWEKAQETAMNFTLPF
jgi:hypothetical protein